MAERNQCNSLRIGARELDALLDRIEDQHADQKNPVRGFVRWDFRVVRADLTLEHMTGSKVKIPVATRNISRGGISILHSAYVYPDAKCHIYTEFEDGRKLDMHGTVMRCTHIGGKVHEIGIKFDEEISTKELLGLDPMHEAYSLESIDPEHLHGTVLILSVADLDQQLLMKLLEDTSLTILIAGSSETAIERAKKGCELILADSVVDEAPASEILSDLRASGIDAPFLIMTSDASGDIRDEMRMAGASGLITKPFTQCKLLQALAEFLLGDGDTGPLYSTLTTDDSAYEILPKFLTNLSRMILTLEQGLRDSDCGVCLEVCRSLANSSTPLGFQPIGQIAVEAERALSKSHNVREAAADIRKLIISCRRIKAKPKAA
ncbi:MAG: response regulator [Phycisphaerales bacterium]|nr:response regulator [Phycisphaerales bacterium]